MRKKTAVGAPMGDPLDRVEDIVLASDDVFIRAAYRLLLGRPADLDGLETHRMALRGELSRVSLLEIISSSPEAAARSSPALSMDPAISAEEFLLAEDQEFIYAVYDAVLHREPDFDGLDHHLKALRTGVSRRGLFKSTLNSSEAASLQTDPATADALSKYLDGVEDIVLARDDAFIQALYRRLLGRSADPEGLEIHRASLRDGVNRRLLFDIVASSPEAILRNGIVAEIGEARSVESIVLADDSDFIWAVYAVILRRDPDPEGLEHHLQALSDGLSRRELFKSAVNSDESTAAPIIADVAGDSGPSVEEILLESDENFVRAAYRAILGRRADVGGLDQHVLELGDGTDRLQIVRNIASSPEAEKIGADIPAEYADGVERALLSSDDAFVWALYEGFLNRAPDTDGLDSHVQMVRDHGRRYAYEAVRDCAEAVAVRAPAQIEVTSIDTTPLSDKRAWLERGAISLPARTGSVYFLLKCTEATAPASSFVRKFLAAWLRCAPAVRLVLWNSDTKKLELASFNDLVELELTEFLDGDLHPRVRPDAPRLAVEASSCGPDSWLLVPEQFRHQVADGRLQELDVILKARMLRLRCAFIFHGADDLRNRSASRVSIDACEQYMQAMLLADVVMPTSRLAADDLTAFLVDHQSADFGPLIRKVGQPADVRAVSSEERWLKYARSIRGTMLSFVDETRRVTSLYYLFDERVECSPHEALFSRRLVATLTSLGVNLIPVYLNRMELGQPDAHIVWPELEDHAKGLALDDDGVSQTGAKWLLIPTAVDANTLKSLMSMARDNDLRVSGILHDDKIGRNHGRYPTQISVDYATYAALDKMFIASRASELAFDEFLLSSRDKLIGAEHRFERIDTPEEVPLKFRRPVTPSRGASKFHGVIWLNHLHDEIFLGAIETGAVELSDRVRWTVIDGSEDGLDAPALAHLAEKLGLENPPLTPEQWATSSLPSTSADFLVAMTSDDLTLSPVALDALALGIPCLLHQPEKSGILTTVNGLVIASEVDVASLAAAIVEFADGHQLEDIFRESEQVSGTWDAFAGKIMASLKADRPLDMTHSLNSQRPGNAYEHLVNLRRRPKLSLCISTYNRAGWLSLSLRNIFDQIPGSRADLEVLVVDNTSTDNTPNVVTRYLDRVDFTYFRNPKNVGMLGNLAVTAQKARGEYIWILGDDDLTRPGVIEKVIDLLSVDSPARLIYLNYGYTSQQDPADVIDLDSFLRQFNILESTSEDMLSSVSALAAKTENFYTAIYSHVYRRDDALRSYCQDTSGPIFSTMASCIPTTKYVLSYLSDSSAYWLGEPALVVNSNVSWIDHAPLFELEQFPRGWDLAERMGANPEEVDRRRSDRLWMTALMWRNLFEKDMAGNSANISVARVLTRLKHLPRLDQFIDGMIQDYLHAYREYHPAATLPPEKLFVAFKDRLRGLAA